MQSSEWIIDLANLAHVLSSCHVARGFRATARLKLAHLVIVLQACLDYTTREIHNTCSKHSVSAYWSAWTPAFYFDPRQTWPSRLTLIQMPACILDPDKRGHQG
eukprot:1157067-Pelagomonas_calceolata.AAC.9